MGLLVFHSRILLLKKKIMNICNDWNAYRIYVHPSWLDRFLLLFLYFVKMNYMDEAFYAGTMT